MLYHRFFGTTLSLLCSYALRKTLLGVSYRQIAHILKGVKLIKLQFLSLHPSKVCLSLKPIASRLITRL
jgi:hypothetical protein